VDILMRERRGYNVTPAMGLGLAATTALGTTVSLWTGLSGAYALQAATAYGALTAVVVAAAAPRQHPFPRFGAANYLTMIRAMMMALVAGLIGEGRSPQLLWPAIGVVTLVAVLDGVDGWLARRSGMASAFGARFDMETDAALILVLSILVWEHGKAGAWVLMCGLMRYAFVAAGWLLPWLAKPLRSTWRGKSVAVVQYIGLGIALAPIVTPRLSPGVAAATLAALVWSFAVDVRWLRRGGDETSLLRHDR
jgi:phosphatidylglycerophosphate synthase